MTVGGTNSSAMTSLTTNGTAAMNATLWTTLYTVPSNYTAVAGVWTEIPLSSLSNTTTSFRGFRFASGTGSSDYCNVAEMEFYGRVTIAEVPGIDINLPAAKTVEDTAPMTLSVTATGVNLTYTWYKDEVIIPGANTAQYTIAAPAAADSGEYWVLVTSTVSGTTASHASQVCDLTVASGPQDATAPSFTKQLPESVNLLTGQALTLKIAADANGVITYKWFKDGVDTGVTGDTFAIASIAAGDAGVYKVVATNTKADAPVTQVATSESPECVITIIGAPVVTGIPATLNFKRDQGFHMFSARAAGMGTFTYQWYKNNVAISGATSRNYSLIDIHPVTHDATYRVRVTSTIPGVTTPLYTDVECVVTVDKDRTPGMVDSSTAYFVDCGDHGPYTLSDDDKLGVFNSVTDQIYGPDRETGMNWGIWLDKPGMNRADFGIASQVTGSQGVFTRYTWPFEQAGGNTDGIPKNMSCRYAKDQASGGTSPNTGLAYRYVQYRFELPPGEYDVIVAPRNSWNNASPVQVYLNNTQINPGGTTIPNGTDVVAISSAYWVTADGDGSTGTLDVEVRTTVSGGTVQLSYIIIKPKQPVPVLAARVADNKIEAVYNNITPDANAAKLIIAVYDGNGVLKALAQAESASVPASGWLTKKLDLSGLVLTNCYYKVFAWDDGYVPLTGSLLGAFT